MRRFLVDFELDDESLSDCLSFCSGVVGRERQVQVDQHGPRRNLCRTDRVLSFFGQRRTANEADTRRRTSTTIQETHSRNLRTLVELDECLQPLHVQLPTPEMLDPEMNRVSPVAASLSPYVIFSGRCNHFESTLCMDFSACTYSLRLNKIFSG